MSDFDPALAEEAFEDDVEGLVAFLRSVLESMQSGIGKVRAAASNGDAPALRAAAHAVKGSSGHLGADAVGSIASRIELAAREGRIEGHAALDALEREIASLDASVAAYLERRGVAT